MEIALILACFSFLLFIVYNSVMISLFGIPSSMSKTYYLLEEKKKGYGWFFTAFMLLMAGTLMPAWIQISDAVGPWMSNFTFLAFIAAAAIAFVGIAPRYEQELEGAVHMTAAKVAAAAALAWCFVVCWPIWYIPLIAMAIAAIIGLCTKTWKDGRDYWLEMMAFDGTFATVITECLLLM